MSSTKRKRPNQSSKRKSCQKAPSNIKRRLHGGSEVFPASIDDDIGSALSLAFAIELMGLGLESLCDDYSNAIIDVTRALIEHLNAAKAASRSLREESREAQRAMPPASISSNIGADI
jgi:hypothetical protein